MDKHTAEVFVKGKVFSLTGCSLAPHLYGIIPLQDVGFDVELTIKLSRELGLGSTPLDLTMTLEVLVQKVASESPLDIVVVKETLPFF